MISDANTLARAGASVGVGPSPLRAKSPLPRFHACLLGCLAAAAVSAQERLVQYIHDADGNRVGLIHQVVEPGTGRRVVTRSQRFLVDELNPTGHAQIVAQADGVEGAQETPRLSRVFLHGLRPVAEVALRSGGDPQAAYGLTDALSSTRVQVGDGGGTEGFLTWDAFGNRAERHGVAPLLHGFAGEAADEDAGRWTLRARDYDPRLGRFTTPDSFEGVLEEPITRHGYLYVSDDPVNRVDPSGHFGSLSDVYYATAARTYLAVMSTAPLASGLKAGVGLITLATALHDPANFVSAFESPAVAGKLAAADLAFVAHYGRRTARFLYGYAHLRTRIRPAVETVLEESAQRIKALDPDAVVGYRGSVARGYKGAHKNHDPLDPDAFDVDGFIVSDRLAEGVPKRRGARFVRPRSGHVVVAEQQAVDAALRPNLEGMKSSRFSYRIYTHREFATRSQDAVLMEPEGW